MELEASDPAIKLPPDIVELVEGYVDVESEYVTGETRFSDLASSEWRQLAYDANKKYNLGLRDPDDRTAKIVGDVTTVRELAERITKIRMQSPQT